jgi:hypothetical protein
MDSDIALDAPPLMTAKDRDGRLPSRSDTSTGSSRSRASLSNLNHSPPRRNLKFIIVHDPAVPVLIAAPSTGPPSSPAGGCRSTCLRKRGRDHLTVTVTLQYDRNARVGRSSPRARARPGPDSELPVHTHWRGTCLQVATAFPTRSRVPRGPRVPGSEAEVPPLRGARKGQHGRLPLGA